MEAFDPDSAALLPVLDQAYLHEISDGDEEFEHELVEIYLDSAPELVLSISHGVEDGDFELLTHASHTLKGSSRSIGAQRIAKVAEQVEFAAKKEDMATIINLVPLIAGQYETLAKEANGFLQKSA